MDEHDGIIAAFLLSVLLGSAKAVVDTLLTAVAAGHNVDDLVDFELPKHLLQERNPTLEARHDDAVDVGMIVEELEGVDNYRFAVEFKKLLRPRFRVHALACSAGKDYSYIHVSILYPMGYITIID